MQIKSPVRQLLLVTLLSLTNVCLADEDQRSKLLESTRALGSISLDMNSIANEMEEEDRQTREKIQELEELIKNNQIDFDTAQQKIDTLMEKLTIKRDLLEKNHDDYTKIQKNFKKFVFQTKAQKWTPLFYTLVALSVSTTDEEEQKVLHGLAGYGLGSIVENTGYGIGGLITYFKYDF